MAIKAIWSIRHDDKEYVPGSILKGLKKEEEKKLVDAGVAEYAGKEPDEK
ncbi:hypothetical protein M5W68_16175 [Paenibacillus larvae]|nr:hypothetical protein [Paenibacillus larvae]MCY9511876.1 hypothetical protein [Paenibacillus larvae]MCY9526608.1 hypothetical protein [Paenibacillus larvae]